MELNILNLIDDVQGWQPLSNEDGSLVLVVNGEIVNHQALKAQLKSSHHFRGSEGNLFSKWYLCP